MRTGQERRSGAGADIAIPGCGGRLPRVAQDRLLLRVDVVVTIFHAEAVSFDHNGFSVMHQPIDQGGRERVVHVDDRPQSLKTRFVVNAIDPVS